MKTKVIRVTFQHENLEFYDDGCLCVLDEDGFNITEIRTTKTKKLYLAMKEYFDEN